MDQKTFERGREIRSSVLGKEYVDHAFKTADDFNRPHELKIHVKGALTNGVTRAEICEVLLQVAIYCGVPAAVDSFRIAREVFAEQEASQAKA